MCQNTRQLQGMRFLVADDDPVQRRITGKILTEYGAADVDEVENGIQVIEHALSQDGYDVVVLDLLMPEINGLQAAKQLRLQRFKGAIVALSGVTGTKFVADAAAAGCDEFLHKTFRKPLKTTTLQDIDDLTYKLVNTVERYRSSNVPRCHLT